LKEKSPAFQWYPKQFMADDKVLAMDWDAVGMHVWLINISWQQEPAGTIPDDTALIRRWLRLSPNATSQHQQAPDRSNGPIPGCNCTDCVWRRVWPQLSAAWVISNGRRVNAGTVRAAERQRAFSESRSKAAVSKWNAYAVRKPCESSEEEVEVLLTKSDLKEQIKPIKEVAVGFELKDAFNATEHAKMVAGELRISSWQVIEAIRLQLELESEKSGKPFEAITLQLIANGQDFSKSRKDLNYPWGWEKFFSEGHWRDRSAWHWKAGGNGKPVSAMAQLKKIKGE
jgi:hypothetical protein